ncbi:putative NRPS-like protein biosynthetic cluster [Paecilomyces lecythidis]
MAPLRKRLLAKTVDDLAENAPDKRFAVIPRGLELTDGFRDLSMKDLAQAVNFMSWWIEDTIGPAQSRETLTYMGRNDVRYFVFTLACQKTGYQGFFPSPRNSDEAHLHLLKVTSCRKVFFSEEREARVLEIKALLPSLEIFKVPTVEKVLSDESGLRPYVYNVSFAEAEDETCCILHSSGTTGMPKPVHLKNGFFKCFDVVLQLPWPAGRRPSSVFNLNSEDLLLATTPFCHGMGLLSFIFSVYYGVPILYGPDKPLSVEYLVELLRTARPTAAVFTPSILDDLSHSPDALDCLKKLKTVYYGGAPLARETGDRVRQYTQIIPIIGATETGLIPSLAPEDEADWDCYEWNEAYGVDMQDTGDGLYEMVIPRHQNSRDFQAVSYTYPDLTEYRTNDLYTRHPTNPRLWKFYGRKDDVIVLSNGEKFNPVEMETIISGHPLVAGAVVIGESRFQAALLVEPNQRVPEMNDKLFIDEIWPIVQVANQTISAHGRIVKNNIRLASKTKPFKRTAKNTIQRRAVLNDYKKEIDTLYDTELTDGLDYYLPKTVGPETITEYIRQTVIHVLGKKVSNTQDLYSTGLDSLMNIQISRILQKSIQLRRPDLKTGAITPQTIYANPTIERLSAAVINILEGKVQAGLSREDKIKELVRKYTSDLPHKQEARPVNGSNLPSVVILTGSTGSLGTYLLYTLLGSESVAKVYCLNRSDAELRQKKGFKEKGLSVDANTMEDKVEFLQVSFGEPRFGLSEDKYQELLDSVDTIIHNAWKVDFNHSVDSFEDTHIRGMRRFVDFSLASRHNAHIHFVSSIGTVGGWTPDLGPLVPEKPMDSSVVAPQGYAEAKYIAERICLEASRRSQVPTTIYRVGQIAGPTTASGQWNPHEWLPTIVATSKAMWKIPNRLGSMEVDWVPVDKLALIMTEIVSTRHTLQVEDPWAVFHLVNPERTSWSSLIPAIQDKYNVEPVEFSAWVAGLDNIQNPSTKDISEKPALKLMSFYRELEDERSKLAVPLDVLRAKAASATMRSLEPISPSLMRNWLQQWNF